MCGLRQLARSNPVSATPSAFRLFLWFEVEHIGHRCITVEDMTESNDSDRRGVVWVILAPAHEAPIAIRSSDEQDVAIACEDMTADVTLQMTGGRSSAVLP
jgi:hypothetical protein